MKGVEKAQYIEGQFADTHIAIVVTAWNKFIVDNLQHAAVEHLMANGIAADHIRIIECPGAYEIPLACQQVALSKKYAAIITLGAVIRGGTPHFEFVAGECSQGVMRVSLDHGLPIAFGVLTVDDDQQALVRSGHGEGSENKGIESAACVLDMLAMIDNL
ncbi:MAG: 6,7-dimethyl-8-ribityllumazine synthase [Paraglaciecola psychrophila]|jgi:6,7-dimethyl-8-ribityllumazine synthase